MKRKFLLTLDLQTFSSDNGLIDFEEDGDDTDFDIDSFVDSEDDLKSESVTPNDDDFKDMIEPVNEEEESETESKPDAEPKSETELESKPDTEKEKKEQTPEENAKFAEMRRQKQAEELLKQRPEYQLAQKLATLYNTDVPTMLQRIEEATLQQQAKQQNVPVEVLKEQQKIKQEAEQLKNELFQMKFQGWQSRIDAEASQMKEKYQLSDEQIEEAKRYQLANLRDPEGPLERAVFALYGSEIYQRLTEVSKTEALAEVSGRKKGIIPPQGSVTPSNGLTAEEKHAAKMLGISEDEYLKYK